MKLEEIIEKRFDSLLKEANKILMNAQLDEEQDLEIDSSLYYGWITSALNALDRCCGKDSTYFRNFEDIQKNQRWLQHKKLSCCLSIVESARYDFKNGYLFDLKTIISAEIFSSSIEQAKELLDKKYKDASAVIAGATLENSLRTLCEINQIKIKDKDDNVIENPKLDRMNSELAKHGVYNILKQKSITAWADLRNKAAHGHYDEYTIDEARLMILGIEKFLANHL